MENSPLLAADPAQHRAIHKGSGSNIYLQNSVCSSCPNWQGYKNKFLVMAGTTNISNCSSTSSNGEI